ncbi:ketosteroid isomerase-like protein [Kibdelosporangium banguiense]|uniref:Ketosteroid isomerase-like protein n=1 Tax=Kibdelosporangium banguiense TaxID=1365924 RepID=A0ABS4U004_9PSEU|nr:nuclear transport factor 2 family protein [Kibdelosporangium banguiense]MBP2329984.1 ketosteroid isomerase-like protein [Kibdelosporangium banguiense]
MTTIHDEIETFVAAFNRGDADALDKLYDEHSVLVPAPGRPLTGDQRRAATAHLLGFGAPMKAEIRHIYQACDIALVIVDWSIEGVGMTGTATDVLRRGPDGEWHYVVDNPFGTA